MDCDLNGFSICRVWKENKVNVVKMDLDVSVHQDHKVHL